MALTPLDIHHKEFKTARFGGYNEEEVDSFLDLVADEFERLIQEDNDIRQQTEHIKKRLSEFEEMQTSLQSALLAATKSAEAVKEQARQESEAMVTKAQEEADSLVRSSQEQARQMTLRAQNERQKLERNFTKLRDIKRRYLQSIREIADAHLAQVAELEAKEEIEGTSDEHQFSNEIATDSPGVQAPPLMEEKEPTENVAAPKEKTEETARPAPPVEPSVSRTRAAVEETETTRAPAVSSEIPSPEREDSRPTSPAWTPEPTAPSPNSSTAVREEFEEKAPLPSANLVDEVLAMDSGNNIYGDFEDEDSGVGKDGGKKSRKEKREKHFFWE